MVNQHLLTTEILKDDWGFRGLVVSDWGATHATVASANAVADSYGIKLKSGPACLANGLLDNPPDLVQVNMPRNYLTKAVGNTDEWLIYIGISQSTGME